MKDNKGAAQSQVFETMFVSMCDVVLMFLRDVIRD